MAKLGRALAVCVACTPECTLASRSARPGGPQADLDAASVAQGLPSSAQQTHLQGGKRERGGNSEQGKAAGMVASTHRHRRAGIVDDKDADTGRARRTDRRRAPSGSRSGSHVPVRTGATRAAAATAARRGGNGQSGICPTPPTPFVCAPPKPPRPQGSTAGTRQWRQLDDIRSVKGGEERSHSNGSCGFCEASGAASYLLAVARRLRRHEEASKHTCSSLVVYSAGFGAGARISSRGLVPFDSAARCTFFFSELGRSGPFKQPAADATSAEPLALTEHGTYIVPLNMSRMPYASAPRRSAKVLKLLGYRLFPWASALLWIDAKLSAGRIPPLQLLCAVTAANKANPSGGEDARAGADRSCAVFVGLPPPGKGFGAGAGVQPLSEWTFERVAAEVIRAQRFGRRSLTDSLAATEVQVARYNDSASFNATGLSLSIIDGAFFMWDRSTPRCRRLNAALACTWFREVACYSDRDQLSFPVATQLLGLSARSASYLHRHDESQAMARRTLEAEDHTAAITILNPFAFHWYYAWSLARFAWFKDTEVSSTLEREVRALSATARGSPIQRPAAGETGSAHHIATNSDVKSKIAALSGMDRR